MGWTNFFFKFANDASGDPSLPTSVQISPEFWITGTVVSGAAVTSIVVCLAIGCGYAGAKRLNRYYHNQKRRPYIEIPDEIPQTRHLQYYEEAPCQRPQQ